MDNFTIKKSFVIWDIMPCSPLEVKRRFGGAWRLRLQETKQETRVKVDGKQSSCVAVEHFRSMRALISCPAIGQSERPPRVSGSQLHMSSVC
jgi:hypothetical protein